jgi:hypothetical protein
MKDIKQRLEFLRTELRNGTISYGELIELESFSDGIDKDDVELLEAAGVKEFRPIIFARLGVEDYLCEAKDFIESKNLPENSYFIGYEDEDGNECDQYGTKLNTII